ncbi:MAG: sugar MFS transporter, partial [Terriglobus sp.]
PMSIEGLGKYTSQGSGLLVMMIVGGAILPEIQGFVADHHGYQPSFLVVLVAYLYVLFFAVNGHKPAKGNEPVDALEVAPPAVV